MHTLIAPVLDSPARTRVPGNPGHPSVRVAAVQTRWHPDPAEHRRVLLDGVARAADAGAAIVFNQELTLARYFCDALPAGDPQEHAEDLETGPTLAMAAEAATAHGVHVHASLFERTRDGDDPRGFNTAVLVGPDGRLVARTRKVHLPVTAGYHEDRYFRPGTDAVPYPVHRAAGVRLGLPTCWDQWFPEPARAYALSGAQLLAYPTAIGSEPDHPGFDTSQAWRTTMVAHGIANGLFIVAANRWGDEGGLTFYGSSFISDPYGRVLVEAPRDADAVLVADLDLAQGPDWLDLFPLHRTRRPDTYRDLVEAAGRASRR